MLSTKTRDIWTVECCKITTGRDTCDDGIERHGNAIVHVETPSCCSTLNNCFLRIRNGRLFVDVKTWNEPVRFPMREESETKGSQLNDLIQEVVTDAVMNDPKLQREIFGVNGGV